ncbi:CpaD family pilus assembly protein [Aliihoeflea sp. PC F10.4]
MSLMQFSPTSRSMRAILLAGVATMLAACAQTDSVHVGSIPDDYRTNHPIVIQEKQETIDVPVGVNDYDATSIQRAALTGFMARYDTDAAPMVQILVPYGSANSAAAGRIASQFASQIKRNGVPQNRVVTQHYQAPPEAVAPIRLSYANMRAQVASDCGRWPEDMNARVDNKNWTNFGCSYQNNLAAQIANPADLITPRARTPIDAENRSNAIDQYRSRQVSPTFRGASELEYQR